MLRNIEKNLVVFFLAYIHLTFLQAALFLITVPKKSIKKTIVSGVMAILEGGGGKVVELAREKSVKTGPPAYHDATV